MTQQEPLNMPLEEAMRTQRAIRRLKPDPVDDALVLHLLELAMKAPTGSNAQNWEFIVVKDREVVAKLGRLNRTAMRAIAAQRVPHGPPLMIWETVDDNVKLQYAVVQRSFSWCRYNSALCWIGSAAALTDAAVSAATSSEKPLGALMWLKNEDNMRAHDLWRSNDQV